MSREVTARHDGVVITEVGEQVLPRPHAFVGIDVEDEGPPALGHLDLAVHDVAQDQQPRGARWVGDDQALMAGRVAGCGEHPDARCDLGAVGGELDPALPNS